MRLKTKHLGLFVLAIGALVFMLWLAGLLTWGKISPGTEALTRPPAPAKVLVVQEEEIPQELTVMGQVISPSLTQISSQVPGKIRRILVEAGSQVRPGQPLIELSAPEFQARLAQAQALFTQATADYRRYQRLLKEEAVSPREFEAMEARFKAARAQEAEARTMSGYTVIQAPKAGVVGERRAAVGDLAQPGQTLLTLYNPQDLQIEGEVNDSYRAQVRLGLAVSLAVPAIDWEAPATLAEVFPLSSPASRTFKVRTEKVSHPNLVPGLFARLSLTVGRTRGMLIPTAALRPVGQLTMVEVLEDGRPTRRQVKPGRRWGEKTEILSGLKAGDRLILP